MFSHTGCSFRQTVESLTAAGKDATGCQKKAPPAALRYIEPRIKCRIMKDLVIPHNVNFVPMVIANHEGIIPESFSVQPIVVLRIVFSHTFNPVQHTHCITGMNTFHNLPVGRPYKVVSPLSPQQHILPNHLIESWADWQRIDGGMQ